MDRKEIDNLLYTIDRTKYEVEVNKINEQDYSIKIIKKMKCCDICKQDKYYKNLTIRQDSRVPFMMVAKNVCRQCLPNVNLILNNLKDSIKSPLQTGTW